VKTISQRELRNDNAQVMRDLEDGEVFTVTRRGVPVARLIPLTDDSDLTRDRPAKRRTSYTSLRRVRLDTATADLLTDLRGQR
jgi:prevent-host-death family protein